MKLDARTEAIQGELCRTETLNQNQSPHCIDSLEREARTAAVHPPVVQVIGSPVTALPFDAQLDQMLSWAGCYESRFVCVANTHMVTEAYWHPEFCQVLSNADIVTPDGMPLVWMMQLMGALSQNRVAGMDILLSLCQLAPQRNVSVFFLGSEARILENIKTRLEREFPTLHIAGMEPLPFRPLTADEDEAIIRKIHESGAGLVFVSLGCPKQEYWMNQHKGKIQAVMIGLGGAFPVMAGDRKWAPLWMRLTGLEWLYRLVQEPRRLGHRYMQTIPPFIWLALKQLLSSKLRFQQNAWIKQSD